MEGAIGVQVLDAGVRYFNGKKQPCRIVIWWTEDGHPHASRLLDPPINAPVLPIAMTQFVRYVRMHQLSKRPRLTPEERRKRHNQSSREYRKRKKAGATNGT